MAGVACLVGVCPVWFRYGMAGAVGCGVVSWAKVHCGRWGWVCWVELGSGLPGLVGFGLPGLGKSLGGGIHLGDRPFFVSRALPAKRPNLFPAPPGRSRLSK